MLIHTISSRSVDQTLHAPGLSSGVKNRCLKSLYKACGHHALLPRSLNVSVCYDQSSNALFRGGYADVWKGDYSGQDVAVKVIRTYSNDELRKITIVGFSISALYVSMTMSCTELLQRGRDVEIPSTSERPAANRSVDF
jgi:hypothetical protein